jgi:ElaB/YqjD/DUF883 family membrane-anchored ribosome-binding protein
MDERLPMNDERVGRALQNLLSDIKVLASDTRELLRQTAGPVTEQLARVRERTQDALAGMEQYVGPLQEKLAEHGRYAAGVSAEHLRVHRWSSLAAVAAIGFAIAAVLAWRNETPFDDHTGRQSS